MGNKVNIRKIAAESGLSIATISRVLNGKTGVTEETRKKVHALLREYNYNPISHLSQPKKIAILCGSNGADEYTSRIFEGIHAYSTEHALNTAMIFKNNAIKMSPLEQIRDQQSSGVIVLFPYLFRENFDELINSELPVIFIDAAIDKSGSGFIDHDAYSGSREATRHLLDLGHRNIGYVEHNAQAFNNLQRAKAYENTMKEAGIQTKPQWHIKTPPGKTLWKGAYLAAKELLDASPEVTAIMATNDSLAAGVIKAGWDSGRKIPRDLSVIGFDNYDFSEFIHPTLTTVHHPIREIGYLAAKEIHLYLKNPTHKPLPREILPTKLIIRESTCPPR